MPRTSRTGSRDSAAPATRSSTRISPTFRGSKSACSAIRAARAARRPPATRRSACATRRPRKPTWRICRRRLPVSRPRKVFSPRRRPVWCHCSSATSITAARKRISTRSPKRCASSTRRSRARASCCRSTVPTWEWGATSSTRTSPSPNGERRPPCTSRC